MKPHLFDPTIAQDVGIECAVLFYNIEYWIQKNQANDKHFYEGKYWTYNSTKAFAELFPYMSERVIYKSLQKLIERGYLIKGNFNQNSFDRTCWYALGYKFIGKIESTTVENPNYQMEESILPNGKIESTKWKNDSNVSNINTNINTDVNTYIPPLFPQRFQEEVKEKSPLKSKGAKGSDLKESEYSEDFERFWSEYPKKINKKLAFKSFQKALKSKISFEVILEATKAYKIYLKATNTQEQYISHPSSWLNGGCYENDYKSMMPKNYRQSEAVMQRGSKNWGSNDDDGFF